MHITINGSGTVPGISAGGLPDGVITTDDLASTVPVAKAWVNFNGTGTVAIRASYNVSSITDIATGIFKVNFTSALADANYAVALFAYGDSGGDRNIICTSTNTSDNASVTSPAAGSFCFKTVSTALTALDQPYTMASVFR